MTASHSESWGYCLKQLALQVPKDTFERWIKPIIPISFIGSTLELSVADEKSREWVADRLTATIMRIAEGVDPSISNVVFSVNQTDASESKFINPVDEGKPDFIDCSTSYQSLYDIIVRPDRIAAINLYSFRHIPFTGTSSWLASIGFSQEKYLKNNGTQFSTSTREVASWTGLSEKTINRLLDDGKLDWFLNKVGTDAKIVNGQVKRQTQFNISALVPLTPGDATDLRDYLIIGGIQVDPILVLQTALFQKPSDILSYPVRLPKNEDSYWAGSNEFLTVHSVVQSLVGHLSPELDTLCSKLHQHLTDGFMTTSWYFLQNGLSQLSSDQGVFVLLARALRYQNWITGEKRDHFWMSLEQLSERLNISHKGIVYWFPKILDTGRKIDVLSDSSEKETSRRISSAEILTHFIERSEFKRDGRDIIWKFNNQSGEFLTQQDAFILKTASNLLENFDRNNLFQWIDDCYVQIEKGKPGIVLSRPERKNDCYVQIDLAIKDCFVQIESNKEDCFVQLLKILKQYKNTFNLKEITSTSKNTIPTSKPHIPKAEEDFNWDINWLVQPVSGETTRKKIIRHTPPAIFVSQIILAMSNDHARDPLAVAVANILANPKGWSGGVADELAIRPAYMRAEIRKHLQTGYYWSNDSSPYGQLLGNIPLVRVQQLANILGVQ